MKTLMVAWLLLVAVAASGVLADETDWTKIEELRKKLLENYDRNALPQRDVNGTTTVHISIFPSGMWIEEEKQIFTLNAWMELVWHDPRLTWDYKDYGNLKRMHMGSDDVWLPEIYLYNNAYPTEVEHYGDVNILVKPDGTVAWFPPVTFKAECPLDITHWPYDTQYCHLFIGTWTHHGWEINIELLSNDTTMNKNMIMKSTHPWQFVGGYLYRYVMYYACCPEPYIVIHSVIILSRASPNFSYTVVIPAVVISLLTLLQFVLPLREPRRLLLGCTCLLLTLLVLLYLATAIPPLATSLPIIVKFYGQTLVVVLVSVGICATVLRLTDGRHPAATTSPPVALKTLLTGRLSTFLFLQRYTEKYRWCTLRRNREAMHSFGARRSVTTLHITVIDDDTPRRR
ncbi:neuronal acetylcholine receptor subunit alpha-6-like isoform X2 [Panulirus ornatus]|uniref:neuronal acetylcholine receptor subunit alpha-6-like isoform X2 n=1 Tax=Panulirus ornatus TaxID=150431 RepID=UPI003A89CED4